MQFNKLHKSPEGKYEKSVFCYGIFARDNLCKVFGNKIKESCPYCDRIKIAVLCNMTKFRNSYFILRRDERRVRKERNAAGTPRCSGRSEQPIREMRK